MEVMKGNDKAAADQFNQFQTNALKLYEIDSRASTAALKAAGGEGGLKIIDRVRIETLIKSDDDVQKAEQRLNDIALMGDSKAREEARDNLDKAIRAARRRITSELGIPTPQAESAPDSTVPSYVPGQGLVR